MVIWVIKTFFVCISSVYSCHLFLISSASVRSLLFLSFIMPILHECSFDISSFLEEIASLSHCIIFLCLFALCREQGIRKVRKCLQTRLSTRAEYSCKRDVLPSVGNKVKGRLGSACKQDSQPGLNILANEMFCPV